MYLQIDYRIQSVNREDVSPLFKEPFYFETEMLFCFVQLVDMNFSFSHFKKWDFDSGYMVLEPALSICVLEMFYQIAKEHHGQKQQSEKQELDKHGVTIKFEEKISKKINVTF